MPRVVITGVGLRLPGAATLPHLMDLYLSAKRATAPLGGALQGWSGGMVVDEEAAAADPAKIDRATVLALLAARDAVTMAGLTADLLSEAGVYVGAGIAGISTLEPSLAELGISGTTRSSTLPRTMANAPAAQISIAYGCQGPSLTYAMACSSSAHAIGEAFTALQAGQGEIMIAGGTEAAMTFGVHKAWAALRLLAQGDDAACRPFCYQRGGLLLGEGSVFFILESLESAERRGAAPLAELVGYGARSDGSHITAPRTEGQAATMNAALKRAGLRPEDIGHISAHGTATLAGDLSETRAIKTVFGAHAMRLPVTASKSFHGHLLGAAGATSLLSSLLAVRYGLIVPTVNFGTSDPDLDLDYVPNLARENADVVASMCNAFGFGGSNASLILTRL